MHIHLAFETEFAQHAALADRLRGLATLSSGDGIPPTETVVLVDGTPKSLEGLPLLRAIVVPWAGVPAATLRIARDRGVAVYNLHHNAAATAEMAVGLLLSAARGIPRLDNALRKGEWIERYTGRSGIQLAGKKIGILGFGSIGRRIRDVCRALGMHVISFRRRADIDSVSHAVVSYQDLDVYLPHCHALVVAAPLTQETEGLIDRRRMDLMRDPRLIVNVGRGPIIVEEDLYDALVSGSVVAAGLDVWYDYPSGPDERGHPSRFPFHQLSNVVMTPHCAGGTQESEDLRMQALGELLTDLVEGREVKPVNLELGY